MMQNDRMKYYDTKLYVPTVWFRAYYTNPINEQQIDWNKYGKKEKTILEKNKNMKRYVMMENADHYIWINQTFSDMIINTINKLL